jgi:hypothetical protein
MKTDNTNLLRAAIYALNGKKFKALDFKEISSYGSIIDRLVKNGELLAIGKNKKNKMEYKATEKFNPQSVQAAKRVVKRVVIEPSTLEGWRDVLPGYFKHVELSGRVTVHRHVVD